MNKIPIGLELFSVRNELKDDLRGTLKAVAEMGYDGVEFADSLHYDPNELTALLSELGLVCCGWHTQLDELEESKIDYTIEFNKTIGNRYVIIPGIPEEMRRTRADWLNLAELFNTLSEKLQAEGLYVGYHNHNVEFAPVEGETPWDTFCGNTNKEVIMQLDFGNAVFGGADVEAILNKYPGRAMTVHLKPFSKAAAKDDPAKGFRPLIGDDDVPWKEVFDICETSGGTEWYIVEYESDLFPPLEAVERCLKNLRGMGK